MHTASSEHVSQCSPSTGAVQAAVVPHRALMDVLHDAPALLRQYVDWHAVHTPVPDDEDAASHVAQVPPLIAVHAVIPVEGVLTAHDTPDVHLVHWPVWSHPVQLFCGVVVEQSNPGSVGAGHRLDVTGATHESGAFALPLAAQ